MSMNYVLIKKGIIYNHFVYLDTDDYEADRILVQNNVRCIRFGKEFRSADYPGYALIMARVPRWKSSGFVEAMGKLEKWMILLHKNGYETLCENIFEKVLANKEE